MQDQELLKLEDQLDLTLKILAQADNNLSEALNRTGLQLNPDQITGLQDQETQMRRTKTVKEDLKVTQNRIELQLCPGPEIGFQTLETPMTRIPMVKEDLQVTQNRTGLQLHPELEKELQIQGTLTRIQTVKTTCW
jgi:hypothetical protein